MSVKVYDVRFQNKSTITIAGPSQSGKSTLVEKIVSMKDELFQEPIEKVYWFCAYLTKIKLDNVIYNVGLPTKLIDKIEPYSLVIIDDYMQELSSSKELTTIMTRAVHHIPLSLIYITQNIFQKGNDTKTRRLNTNYLILFKNPHDKLQIDYIGRQMYPYDKGFLSSAFEDATSRYPYTYLLIDCHQDTPDEIRVRTNITNKSAIKVYVPASIALYE